MITLTFPLKPLAKQSYRSTRTGHGYLASDVVAFRDAVKWMAVQQLPSHNLIETPISVTLRFVFQAPKSLPAALRRQISEGSTSIHKSTKPDIDNLTKAIFDALNGVVWVDDALVVSLTANKWYGDRDQITVNIEL